MRLAVGAVGLVAAVVGIGLANSSPGKGTTFERQHVQALAMRIVGPAGGGERVSPLGNFAIAPGVPVRLTVTNFTREFHTFTIPGLHVSRLIFPARRGAPRKTTFTFTASKWGPFAWSCAICRAGGHGHRHWMGGTIWVIIDPSLLP